MWERDLLLGACTGNLSLIREAVLDPGFRGNLCGVLERRLELPEDDEHAAYVFKPSSSTHHVQSPPDTIAITGPFSDSTALQVAVRGGHRSVVEILLAVGADYDITGRGGETAQSLAQRLRKDWPPLTSQAWLDHFRLCDPSHSRCHEVDKEKRLGMMRAFFQRGIEEVEAVFASGKQWRVPREAEPGAPYRAPQRDKPRGAHAARLKVPAMRAPPPTVGLLSCCRALMDEVRSLIEQIFPSRDDILLHLETSWSKKGKSLWQTLVWLEDPSKGSRRVLGEKEHASVEASQYLALAMAQSVSCKFQSEVVGGPESSASQTHQESLVSKSNLYRQQQQPTTSSAPNDLAISGSQSWQERLRKVFDFVDKDMDGFINKRELILACRTSKEVADFFGLPQTIRAEDGSRDSAEKLFQAIDLSNDRQWSWEEFSRYYCPGGPNDPGSCSGSGRPPGDGQQATNPSEAAQVQNSANSPTSALLRPSSAAGKPGALPKLSSQQVAEAGRPRSRAGSGSDCSTSGRRNLKRSSSATAVSQMW
eukprot:gnl/MRDRNA2_/MRDRNA2_126529_c0_seq1.p1 gnl/MRDRNA2_/MRDRNA2_126529_c0~~gnl/MRDRNA2_/MRDRNA2_126529_c0_seq1.p1  ORF type:complete len:535 (+),score=98.49 gnl/MRDRNA2_/MRDRNA2_126529_c0_seq1:110-1714(+)